MMIYSGFTHWKWWFIVDLRFASENVHRNSWFTQLNSCWFSIIKHLPEAEFYTWCMPQKNPAVAVSSAGRYRDPSHVNRKQLIALAIWRIWYLVGGLEHDFYFSIYWECHHPNWLSYFSEGLKQQTSYVYYYYYFYCFNHMVLYITSFLTANWRYEEWFWFFDMSIIAILCI